MHATARSENNLNHFEFEREEGVGSDTDTTMLIPDSPTLNDIELVTSPLLRESKSNRESAVCIKNVDHRVLEHCHMADKPIDRRAMVKLVIVSSLCFIFMLTEIIGGVLSGSLAVATDATHMACDLAGFLVSLFAIWVTKKPATARMSFGFFRAEIVGALVSILIIWQVTGVLVYLAARRIHENKYDDVEPNAMLITAGIGVTFNVVMAFVLHGCKDCNVRSAFGHGHSHVSPSHSNGSHAHSHGNNGHSHDNDSHSSSGHNHSHSHHSTDDDNNIFSDAGLSRSDDIHLYTDDPSRPTLRSHHVFNSSSNHSARSIQTHSSAANHSSQGRSHSEYQQLHDMDSTSSARFSNSARSSEGCVLLLEPTEQYYLSTQHNSSSNSTQALMADPLTCNQVVPGTPSDDDVYDAKRRTCQSTGSSLGRERTSGGGVVGEGGGGVNINVRAAMVHVIGDLVQSVGVLVAAIIMKLSPGSAIADPICTFIFSFLVLCTTVNVLWDIGIIIMQGTPHSLDYGAIKRDLARVDGVKMVHSLNVWSLTLDKINVGVHLAVGPDCRSWQSVLTASTILLRNKYNAQQTTIQVERYDEITMTSCQLCQKP